MASFIELIAKIKQKNNGTFKLVDAQDVECEDGKGLDEVLNEKLDENQGIENAGKTMVVGADGNLVVGDSSPKNVYTKEEVDYMLADKMDKSYYDISITDDTTIETTLAGNFKIDSIEGNIYQNTTLGNQLFDASKLPTKSQGGATVTNNGDGSFTISGSGKLSENFSTYYDDSNIVNSLKEGDITFNCEQITYPIFQIYFLNAQNQGILILSNTSTSTTKEITSDVLSQTVKLRFFIYGSVSSGKDIVTGKVKPILYQDGDGTWEHFTGGQPSPNPDYPQHIYGVEELNIKLVGKNVMDNDLFFNAENWQTGYINKYYMYLKPNTTYTFSRKDNVGYQTGIYFYIYNSDGSIKTQIINSSSNYYQTQKVTFTTKDDGIIYFGVHPNVSSLNKLFEILGYAQLEESAEATPYTPYQEQRVNITPPQPLYQNDIANVESGDYEYEKQKYVVTGNETFLNDYQTQSGFYGRYFDLENGNGVVTEKIWCNYLSYIQSSWSLASEGCSQNTRTQIHLKFSNDRLGITDNTPLEEKRTAFANYLKQLYSSGDPLYVVIKVTKTTQPIPPEDLAKMKSLKTNAGVNNIFVGGEIKPTINARYPRDLALVQQQLEQKVLLMSETLTETRTKLLLQGGN